MTLVLLVDSCWSFRSVVGPLQTVHRAEFLPEVAGTLDRVQRHSVGQNRKLRAGADSRWTCAAVGDGWVQDQILQRTAELVLEEVVLVSKCKRFLSNSSFLVERLFRGSVVVGDISSRSKTFLGPR